MLSTLSIFAFYCRQNIEPTAEEKPAAVPTFPSLLYILKETFSICFDVRGDKRSNFIPFWGVYINCVSIILRQEL
jgi:hypothetical protein